MNIRFPDRLLRALLLLWPAGVAFQALALQPLTVLTSRELAFGRFAAGLGGNIVVSPGGVRTSSGGVVLLSSASGSSAQMTVTGEPNTTYSIGLPLDGVLVLRNATGAAMPVKTFVSTPGSSGQVGVGGSQIINIGATLVVAPGQAVGNYSGTFAVSLNYN